MTKNAHTLRAENPIQIVDVLQEKVVLKIFMECVFVDLIEKRNVKELKINMIQ